MKSSRVQVQPGKRTAELAVTDPRQAGPPAQGHRETVPPGRAPNP